MRQTIKLFPLTVYKNFYNKTDEIKRDLFSKLDRVFEDSEKNNNVFMRQGTLCSYHTNSYLHTEFLKETQEVVKFVETCAKEYWDEMEYHKELEPFVFQMWANKTPRGGYIDSHLHGNMPFTAVLYVDASSEQGNLLIENPLEMILMTQPISPDIKYPMAEEISVKSGDLIMFPGYIRHSVKPNNTDKPRLILGFNIGSRGKYWTSQWVNNV